MAKPRTVKTSEWSNPDFSCHYQLIISKTVMEWQNKNQTWFKLSYIKVSQNYLWKKNYCKLKKYFKRGNDKLNRANDSTVINKMENKLHHSIFKVF